MNALENHFEECEDFILFLEAGSELVPSEIYEKVSEITNGEFVKDFQMFAQQRIDVLKILVIRIGFYYSKH